MLFIVLTVTVAFHNTAFQVEININSTAFKELIRFAVNTRNKCFCVNIKATEVKTFFFFPVAHFALLWLVI